MRQACVKLCSEGAEAVWGHSVAELCQDVIALHAELEPLAKIGGPLDKYYIISQWSAGRHTIGRIHCGRR